MLIRCLFITASVMLTAEISASQPVKTVNSGYITRTYNQLIRESHPNWWGNFNLDPMIKPGAMGVIDIDSGVFQPTGESLSDFETTISPLNEVMTLASEHVHEAGGLVGAKGSLAHQGDAQVQLKWQFSRRGAMMSRWVLAEQQGIKDPGKVLREHLNLLKSIASDESMYDSVSGISQGFGVITSVIMASSRPKTHQPIIIGLDVRFNIPEIPEIQKKPYLFFSNLGRILEKNTKIRQKTSSHHAGKVLSCSVEVAIRMVPGAWPESPGCNRPPITSNESQNAQNPCSGNVIAQNISLATKFPLQYLPESERAFYTHTDF